MMSLFSSFDVKFLIFPFFLEFFSLIFFFSLITNFNMIFSFIMMFKVFIFNFISSLKLDGFNKIIITFFVSFLIFIFLMNFFSIFPFNYAYTSHISIVLFMSFSIWLSYMLFFLFSNLKGVLSHFIPEGTPIFLVPVLFLIELLSSLIRPITLTVRLVANILAGHLILILLSKVVYFFSLSYLFYFGFNLVEIFVALIQAYIFVILLVLYYCEMF